MGKKTATRKSNRRASNTRQRRHQHLLDVKVRARKASARRTQKVIFTISIVVIFLSIVGGVVFGAKRVLNTLFFANPDYAVKSIEIKTDGKLGNDAILKAAGIEEGANVFALDLAAIEDRLRGLPQVEEANVQRLLPNKIYINVQERRPVAWLVSTQADNSSFNLDTALLIDARGIVIKPRALAPEYIGLPVIIGIDTATLTPGQYLDREEVRAALTLIRATSESLQSRFQIQTIDVSKEYCLVVTDKQRSSAIFGLDQFEVQLHRLESLLSYCDQNTKELQTVNLMAERNIPVTFVAADGAEPASSSSPAVQIPNATPAPASAAATTSKLPHTKKNPAAKASRTKAEHPTADDRGSGTNPFRKHVPVSSKP